MSLNSSRYVRKLDTENCFVIATSSGDHNTALGYTIALITFGACLGNMFMAGKIRNIMKMKIPSPANWKDTKTNATKNHSHAKEEQSASGQQNNARHKYSADFKANISVIPENIAYHMTVLKLPIKLVSTLEIKDAYRQAVLQYHPDRLSIKDIDLKPLHEVKFKQSTEAYQALLAHFKPMDLGK